MCIGQNYLRHIEETGATRPEYPTVFAKFARALIGDGEPIVLPSISDRVDWEVELVVVVGREVRNADAEAAAAAIAGFTVGNDVSARDLQSRTSQWLQGKTCESTTPVGPCMTTADVTGTEPDLAISCAVDGVVRQDSRTSDLLFKPVDLVRYLSHILTAGTRRPYLHRHAGWGWRRDGAAGLSPGRPDRHVFDRVHRQPRKPLPCWVTGRRPTNEMPGARPCTLSVHSRLGSWERQTRDRSRK